MSVARNAPAGDTPVPLEGAALHALLVDSVREYAIFALDRTGHVLTWNVGAQRIKGYTAQEIVGRHFSAFYPPEDVAAGKADRALDTAVREGRFEAEGWRVRKDGSRFWASVAITPLRDARGRVMAFGKVTRDLTERREAQQRAIADASRVAASEAANRAKSEFLATLSHELRTPLNAIGGYADLLSLGVAGPVTAEQREYTGRIRAAQQHLLAIINDLLNYSRIEAGQVAYEMRPVAFGGVLDRTVPMVATQAAAKRIEIHRGPCPAEVTAWADEQKLEQVVLNLLSNAVKFTPPDGTVTLECDASDRHVVLRVRDTGPGIPEEKWAAIFEPFVQLGRSLVSAHEGTGLGLAISRDLARAMGGELTVASAPGAGATFTLTLQAG